MADTVYARAAELIAERGWRQGSVENVDDACLCLMDAVVLALSGDPAEAWAPQTEAAWYALRDLLVKRRALAMPMQWNDQPGRTVDEVLALLTQADRG